jgi:hypothetical protein
MVEMKNADKILNGKPEGKRRFTELYRHRWEDNIKMDHKEIESEDVDWIHVAQDRVQQRATVNTVNETSNSI